MLQPSSKSSTPTATVPVVKYLGLSDRCLTLKKPLGQMVKHLHHHKKPVQFPSLNVLYLQESSAKLNNKMRERGHQRYTEKESK